MSSIIFHCLICFESFDCDKHYPVVLPCGHTYICNECANRIDKCYECRKDLFYYVEDETKTKQQPSSSQRQQRTSPAAGSSYTTRPSQSRGRYGGRSVPNNNNNIPKKNKVKKRLPLPKNLVLMSLIEANQNTTSAQRDVAKILSGKEDNASNNNDDEDFDVGLRLFLENQVCGTYMVTSRNGLRVHEHKPHENGANISSESASNYYEDADLEISTQEIRKVGMVNFGDHVQVVSIEDGWAILARQNGYVSADESKLIRVCAPRDKACRAEGMLYNLFVHWKSIENKQKKVQKLKNELIKELKHALTSSPNNNDNATTIMPATDAEIEILETRLQKEEEKRNKSKEEERLKQEEKKRQIIHPPEVREPESTKEQITNSHLHHHSKQEKTPVKLHTVHPNMRTGRSGHCALLSSSASNKKAQATQYDAHPLHKISTHTGLTMIKKNLSFN